MFSVKISDNLSFKTTKAVSIDLFFIVSAHACIGHVMRYFPIIGETLGQRILSH